jgi:hypothetical protein
MVMVAKLAKQSLTAGQSFVQALIQMSALRPVAGIMNANCNT